MHLQRRTTKRNASHTKKQTILAFLGQGRLAFLRRPGSPDGKHKTEFIKTAALEAIYARDGILEHGVTVDFISLAICMYHHYRAGLVLGIYPVSRQVEGVGGLVVPSCI